MVIIYLGRALLPGSCCLPSPASRKAEYKRAAYNPGFTWHYSPQGLPEPALNAGTGSSYLPFSPSSRHWAGQLFSVALSLYNLHCKPRRYRGVLPFAVRTFLTPIKSGSDDRLIDAAKLNDFPHRALSPPWRGLSLKKEFYFSLSEFSLVNNYSLYE